MACRVAVKKVPKPEGKMLQYLDRHAAATNILLSIFCCSEAAVLAHGQWCSGKKRSGHTVSESSPQAEKKFRLILNAHTVVREF